MSEHENKQEQKKERGSLKQVFAWLRQYWGAHPGKFVLLVVMTMACTALSISYPIFFKMVVDGLKNKVPASALTNKILLLMAFGVSAAVLNWVLMSLRGWTNISIEMELRNKLFARLTQLGPRFFAKQRTGDIVTRLTDDLGEKLSWFTCSGVFRAVQGAVLFTFIVIVIFRMSPMLAVCTLVPVPAVAFLYIFNEKTFERRYHRLQDSISKVNDFLEACFSGIRVLKVYNRLDNQRQGFSSVMQDRVRAEVRSIQSEGLFNACNNLIDQVGVIIVLLVGGKLVIDGKLSLGSFVAFNTYSVMMLEPLWNMGYFFVTAKRASVSLARTSEIERAVPDVEDPAAPVPAAFGHIIAFENVTFSHDGQGRPAVQGFSFTVAKGTKVALMGEVGSGKTTIVHLLLRFFDPGRGRVAIDGMDIKNFRLAELRAMIGYAPQEALLFSDTILNNVIFHRSDVDLQRAVEASRISQLDREVEGFANGFQTEIGQRGLSLSGGQKQRASLARAIVERIAAGHPKVLILDDITSALDATTEAMVWRELEEKLPQATYLIISHRTSTIERADRIIVLRDGRIEETGSHRELMAKNGYYVSLRERQKLEENGNGHNGSFRNQS